MKVLVLRPFLYGADGIHAEQLSEGDEADILDDLIPGLVAEGFVMTPEDKTPGADVKPKSKRGKS